MADTKISALTNGTPALATDRFPIARAGANYYLTPANILSYGTSPITGTTITATTGFVGPTLTLGTAGSVLGSFTSYSSNGQIKWTINDTGSNGRLLSYGFGGAITSMYLADATGSGGEFAQRMSSGSVVAFNSTNNLTGGSLDTYITRYAAKQLMISGDGTGTASGNTGWIIGNLATTQSAIWGSHNVPSGSNFSLYATSVATVVNGPSSLYLAAGSSNIVDLTTTAGRGIGITAGTATTDVQAISATQTWNNAAITFTGLKYTITDTASNAASKIFDHIVGATSYWAMNKSGIGTMAAYGAGAATFSAAGVISSVSDESVKTNIRPFKRGLDAILALSRKDAAITYNYNAAGERDYGLDTVHDYTGFSANIVEGVIPEAVGRNADGRRSFSDRPVTAALVNAIATLEARIRSLESVH